jgi:protoporphyrin/coproporphyrin ferrochelatase
VLLVNLGTPDAPTPGAVRRYLGEFLSDPRIVDMPRILWLPLLHGLILNIRPKLTAKEYNKIWRIESNESPLRYYTRMQAQAVAKAFGGDAVIDWAMRYGQPSVASRISTLRGKGCTRLLIVPLYPQYSATTTASVADAVTKALKDIAWQPETRTAAAFPGEPAYIKALASVARTELGEAAPERVIISFHGLPQRYVDAGDPYYAHCSETAQLLRTEMGWTEDYAPMTFQSKFGRGQWLAPATEATVLKLAGEGVKNITIITPGFVADCIETLSEIDIALRQTFLAAGGAHFNTIACLNDAPEMVGLLQTIIRRETAGWI